jgi:imidazolonepropionase-like amidohydrolase
MQALQSEEFIVRAEILPSPTILRHATTNAAKLLRRPDLGTLSVGATADILILDKNPLEDISILDRPEHYLCAVLKEGVVHTSTLPQLPTVDEELKTQALRLKKSKQ